MVCAKPEWRQDLARAIARTNAGGQLAEVEICELIDVNGPAPTALELAALMATIGGTNRDDFEGAPAGTLLFADLATFPREGTLRRGFRYRPARPWNLAPHPDGGLAELVDRRGGRAYPPCDFEALP